MKAPALRQCIQTGVVFGIIHIFLILIGFNSLFGTLIARIAKVKQSGPIPAVIFLVVYVLFMGLWAGITAARKSKPSSFGSLLLRAAIAGVALGLVSLLINVPLAILLTNKIDPRLYLNVLSLDFMKASLFGLPAPQGVLANAGVLLLGSLVGGTAVAVLNLRGIKKSLSGLKKAAGWVGEKIQNSLSGRYRLVWQVILLSVLALAVIFLPLKWGSYWNYVIGMVGIYVILGLGLNIIVGLSGQLVLGYIAFFAIGAYSVALLNSAKPHNLMWGFWPALILGVLLAALAGLLLGLPLMRLRGDYLAIVTLGFGEIIRILLKSDLLTGFTGGPRGIQNIQGPRIFGHNFNDVNYMYLIIIAVLFSMFLYHRLEHSRTGRAWLSIREDETVARATGVNTSKYKLLALVLGAALAGLAGGIYAARNQFTGPDEHSLMASINTLSLIIVGGMGNIPGTILGAFALKGLPEILREFANFRLLAFGALLVAMMLSRPEGLIPSRRPTFKIPDDPDEEPKQEVGEHER